MKKFNEFLAERAGKGLTIFDIDDTMFVSKARVIVKNKNTGQSKPLTPMEFNSYKLRKNEEYDFGEFRSAKIFYQTATPIARMVQKAKAIISNATKKGSKVIVVTARSDMDDKNLFIKTFEAHGIPMKNVYVERAGNMSGSSAENKKVIFRKYLKTGTSSNTVKWIKDEINNRKLSAMVRNVKKYYPEYNISSAQSLKPWVGLRPLSADGLPYIGPFKKYPNLINPHSYQNK